MSEISFCILLTYLYLCSRLKICYTKQESKASVVIQLIRARDSCIYTPYTANTRLY